MVIDVKNLMTKIIDDAIKCKASDIHIYPHISGNSFIKLRINGNLSKYESYTNRELDAVNSSIKILTTQPSDNSLKGKVDTLK